MKTKEELNALKEEVEALNIRLAELSEEELALGGLSNNIFASTYTYVIPEKEKLIAQVEAILEKWEGREE